MNINRYTSYFDAFFANSPDLIMLIDQVGDILCFNKTLENLWSGLAQKPRNLTDIITSCVTRNERLVGQAASDHVRNSANIGQNWDVDFAVTPNKTVPVVLSVNLLADDPHVSLLTAKVLNQQKSAEQLLSDEQQLYQIVFNSISEAVFLAPINHDGIHGNFVAVNDTACTRLGFDREELLRMNARNLNPSVNIEKVKSFGKTIRREKRAKFESIHVSKDGTQIPVEVVALLINIANRDYVLSVARDLREINSLKKNEERFARLLEYGWDEIYIFNTTDLILLHANQGATNNLGFALNELRTMRASDLMVSRSEDELRTLVEPLVNGEQKIVVFETTLRRKDNTIYPVEVRVQLSHSEVPPVFLASLQDISKRKQSEQQLNYLSNYDILTGLPNRSLFFDRLNMAMQQCNRTEKLTALLSIDIDGFNTINDTLGHDSGDELIKILAHRLSNTVRRSDTVARLGGDEFALILTNISQLSVVESIARKILDNLSEFVDIQHQRIHVTASIGVSIYPFEDTHDPYTLLKQADLAMQQAKESGKNNIQYYTESIAREQIRRLQYERELKSALDNNQFFIVVQPRVSLPKGEFIGGEVLLRWRHPAFGLVSPLDFIPYLESSGLIVNVGLWVISETCQFISHAKLSGTRFKISVNVTSRQLNEPDFFTNVNRILDESGVSRENIELEITESVILEKNDTVMKSLCMASKAGINICLDDFGTGYSSLSYLKQFPIKVLKIDRSFVQDLLDKEDNRTIVEAIIGLGKNLNLHLVAEGIETKDQAELLVSMGCFEGQGFYFSKPIMPGEYLKQLENRSP